MKQVPRTLIVIMAAVLMSACLIGQANAEKGGLPWMDESIKKLEEKLVAEYGEGQRARL